MRGGFSPWAIVCNYCDEEEMLFMQTLSSDLIDVTNEVGMSGKFIELARTGELVAVGSLIQNRVTIAKELAAVEGKLKACNDPAMLAEFEKWCRKGKTNFQSRLPKLAADLEARKSQLLAELHQIDQQLDQKELGANWAVDPTPMTSLAPRLVRKSDSPIAERNEIIDSSLKRPDFEICKLLDQQFTRDGELSEHFPKTWDRSHGVRTFTAAYLDPKCRGKVHTLISKRRRLHSYPKV
jgi:hypothetical protein